MATNPARQFGFPPDGGTASTLRQIVELPGATLSRLLRSDEFQPLEWCWNAEPNEAWYDPARSRSNPTQFEVISKKVPSGSSVIVLDFSFEPYKFSAVGAHEWEPVGRNTLRGSLAYQFRIAGRTPGNVEFYLDPKASVGQSQEFLVDKVQLWTQGQPSDAEFAQVRAAAFGAATGTGTATLPQRTGRYGAEFAPYAWAATDDQVISLRGIVYGAVSTPLACVEGRILGYVCSTSVLQRHIKDMNGVLR